MPASYSVFSTTIIFSVWKRRGLNSKKKYSINIVRSGKVYSMVQPSLETLSPTSLSLQFRHLLNSHQSKPRLRSPPDFHWQVGKGTCPIECVTLGSFFQITLLQAGIDPRHTKEQEKYRSYMFYVSIFQRFWTFVLYKLHITITREKWPK